MITLKTLQKVRGVAGVYFLYNKDNELVYIGQSKNIYTRILEHKFENKKKFESFIHIKFDDTFTREIYEITFISIAKPKYNKLVVDDINKWALNLPTSFKKDIHNISFYSKEDKRVSLHAKKIFDEIFNYNEMNFDDIKNEIITGVAK